MAQVSFNFMAAVTICSDFGAQENKICHCFLHLFAMKWWDWCHDLSFLNVEFQTCFFSLLFHPHQEVRVFFFIFCHRSGNVEGSHFGAYRSQQKAVFSLPLDWSLIILGVLSMQVALTKMPLTGWLKEQVVISHSSGGLGLSLRSWYRQTQCLVRTHYLVHSLFAVPTGWKGGGILWGVFYKGTNPIHVNGSRDIAWPTKVHQVKAMVFSVIMYGCESWTVKKAECWRIDVV